MKSKPSLDGVLADLEKYLQYLRDDGVRSLEVSPATLRALRAPPPTRPAAPVPVRRPVAAGPRPPAATPAVIPVDVPPQTTGEDGPAALARFATLIGACRQCPLHKTRTKAVPGQGAPAPEVLFVGEAPGEEEDRQGLAFVGAAGQLLTTMITAMGYTRDQVFIANILKCRPPGNRTPLPEEMATCLPYLRAQIAALQPKVIVALGGTAVRGLLHLETGITRLRGQWQAFEGIPVMPTFHPAYLLRNPSSKRDAWTDLQEVLHRLGRTPPPVRKKTAGSAPPA